VRIEPALTYKGALAILGKYDSRTLKALDKLLGGFILGSGTIPAVADAWGWVDQKNEAFSLLRTLLNSGLGMVMRTGGYSRSQLIAAAHTAIVAESYFEAARQVISKKVFKEVALSRREKAGLVTRMWNNLPEALYNAPIPMPSPTCGLQDTLLGIREYFDRLNFAFAEFMVGTSDSPEVVHAANDLVADDEHAVDRAVALYEERYRGLMEDVPEFGIWAFLNEHSATRHEILGALSEERHALDRLTGLLTAMTESRPAMTPPREIVWRYNQTVMSDPVIPDSSVEAVPGITLPSVRETYVVPRFRHAVYDDGAFPSDERWWRRQPQGSDFEAFLAGHLVALESFNVPILLLGHPGAGKSLLSKVLAASLPEREYAVVRVPLRRVDADAPVYAQVQQGLDLATSARLDWAALSEDSKDVVRVVILDGYDELLQASESGRAGYLQEVEEFQRVEAGQGRPVIAVVTSRTVVADRMRIPAGCAMAKLEDFTDEDIHQWVESWNRVNRSPIAKGPIRAFPVEMAVDMRELAKQPLLLLMLALYIAEPTAPDLSVESSLAVVFKRLIEGFVWREVDKFLRDADEDDRRWALRDRLDDLTVAAFAMFNRGSQSVTEDELGSDLVALIDRHARERRKAARAAQSVVGQFFFVHIAEARQQDVHIGRSYEFLHATFGEYLMAADIMKMLERMVRSFGDVSFSRASASYGERVDDDRLFAMLSHQVLATRMSIVDFAQDLFAEQSDEYKVHLARLLESLLAEVFVSRRTDRFADYQPAGADHLARIATYSANLALLRVLLYGEEMPLAFAALDGDSGHWQRLVHSWRAGLTRAAWAAVVEALDVTPDGLGVVPRLWRPFRSELVDLAAAQLTDERALEVLLQTGAAARGLRGAITNDPRFVSKHDVDAALLYGILHGIDEPVVRGVIGRYLASETRGSIRPRSLFAFSAREMENRVALAPLSLFLLLNARQIPRDVAERLLAEMGESADDVPERELVSRAFSTAPPVVEKQLEDGTLASDEQLAELRERLSDDDGRRTRIRSLRWLFDPAAAAPPGGGGALSSFDPENGVIQVDPLRPRRTLRGEEPEVSPDIHGDDDFDDDEPGWDYEDDARG
jgi:hypothetical protein